VNPTARISVVMATYNGARYLERALSSVARQSRKPDEVVVVDDGSSDDSAAIAEAMGARVVRLQHQGVCVARNTGIQAARYECVALMDQDDEWLESKLERQLQAILHDPAVVMVATDVSKIDPAGNLLESSMLTDPAIGYDTLQLRCRAERVDFIAKAAEQLHKSGWFLLPSAVLICRRTLIDAGMFDPTIRLHEDVSCFLRVLMHGDLAVIREPLLRWRIHDANTHRDELGMLRGRLELAMLMQRDARGEYPRAYRTMLEGELPHLHSEIARRSMHAGLGRESRAHARAAAALGGMNPKLLAYMVASFLPGGSRKLLARLAGASRRASSTLGR
jgi:glycosyltransferase involved in cell wall biosynthesis